MTGAGGGASAWLAEWQAALSELRMRIAGAGARAWRRLIGDLGPLVQKTLAAAIAWFIASHVANHHQPFFAPIAAVVALNTSLGERGTNALRLLLGVMLGIVIGELSYRLVGGGYGTLALATFTAMALARLLGGARIVVAQAASGAILTVVAARAETAANRLEDALIGAGVALVFTQVVFSPEPVRLLRRAEAAALREMSIGLGLTARALEGDDVTLVMRALDRLRQLRDGLSELARVRRTSASTARHSLIWWRRGARVAGERESAGHLDLLGGSCLTLTRIAAVATPAEGDLLAPSVYELADVLGELARDPGDPATRQRAAERVRELATETAGNEPADSTLGAARLGVRMVAGDVLLFAGAADRAGSSSPAREPA